MTDILKNRLIESIDKTLLIILTNDFRYKGKLRDVDDSCIELLDFKSNSIKVLAISDIKRLEVEDES